MHFPEFGRSVLRDDRLQSLARRTQIALAAEDVSQAYTGQHHRTEILHLEPGPLGNSICLVSACATARAPG